MPSLLTLLEGDITKQRVDAVANAANTGLLGGGGVDGAIHRAGGPAIMEECEHLRAARGGCPTGSAVITTAGSLAAKAVLHTAGPRWRGGGAAEAEALASCYQSCLELAREHGLRSIAFPSISTGIYGYPIEEAAGIALATVKRYLDSYPEAFDEIRFVLFSREDLGIYQAALERG